ncbi:transposase InsO family protein [Neobacillus niacini]|nr:transposase InsO family protein [Neobacillus niacini]
MQERVWKSYNHFVCAPYSYPTLNKRRIAQFSDCYGFIFKKNYCWQIDKRMTKELVITALKRAIGRQPPKEGIIHHSDRGSQYASKEYQQILRDHRITTSMSRKGNCYDNACIESFHSVIKKELIFHENYQTRKQAKNRILENNCKFL